MRLRLVVLFLALAVIFAGSAFCDQLNQAELLFYQGNTHYSEEKFGEAIADYEGALTLGLESGPLYYNLGNAYFKADSLGKAILNYLRAQRLIPGDADLKSNLRYAQSLIKGGRVLARRNWLTRMFFKAAGSFSLNKITLLSAGLYAVLSILLILMILVKALRKIFVYTALPLLIALMFCSSLFLIQFYQTIVHKGAVVIAQSTDFKFEPLEGATTFFTLNEGESVIVGTAKEEWIKARRRDGKQAWVKQSDIELL